MDLQLIYKFATLCLHFRTKLVLGLYVLLFFQLGPLASEEGSVLVDDLLTKFEVAEDHFEYLVLLHPYFPFFFPLFLKSIVVALDVILHESQSCPPHFPLAGPKEYFG